MSKTQTADFPESGYGKTLRHHGLIAEARKMDELIHRERMCDAHCGGRDNEIERLRAGIQSMLDGNYPHPRTYRGEPGMQCPHGTLYYQECPQCDSDWLEGLLK